MRAALTLRTLPFHFCWQGKRSLSFPGPLEGTSHAFGVSAGDKGMKQEQCPAILITLKPK